MKKKLFLVFLLLISIAFLYSQGTGKEVANLYSAIREASPGDYITLPNGSRYVLTQEEIAIARGNYITLSSGRRYVVSEGKLTLVQGKTDPGLAPDDKTGKEIPNLQAAVREANPGDYIALPNGSRYVLTKEEIAIARNEFDYGDLSRIKADVKPDGTRVKTISPAHTVFEYPDGQSVHVIKTSQSFTAFMHSYIVPNYYLGPYIDYLGNAHASKIFDPPAFDVFRAAVQFQYLTDGVDLVMAAFVRAYNYKGGVIDENENFEIEFFPTDDWAWGYVNGTHKPVGEKREIIFDVE